MGERGKNRAFNTPARKRLFLRRLMLNVALPIGLLGASNGCTRFFYRKQADQEVGEILAQKDKYADWKISNWWVYPDPKARFADPSNPDRPPKPPDDPAAYALSPNPQKPGRAGVKRIEGSGYLDLIAKWDQENREQRARTEASEGQTVEPPVPGGPQAGQEEQEAPPAASAGQGAASGLDKLPATALPSQRDAIAEAKARSLLDISGQPAYLLTLDQAAELAMFNSREYQDQRENLYLAALPVSQERFSFMSQFFAASQDIRSYAGRTSPNGPENNWAVNNGVGLAKVLPTGALLLLNFSNQTIFNFNSPKNITSISSLNFDAIQPLLQGGGKAVALESLTQAERNLLYQIRTYARFRKSLYVEIASNNGGAISGASFQPSGVLSNNSSVGSSVGGSGLTPGVIPAVPTTLSNPIVPPGSPGSQSLAPALTPAPSGYLNTMLQKVQVYIDQENIDVLSTILQRYRGLLEGDLVGPLQVQSVEQQLLTGRYTLVGDQQDYIEALDAFKLEIGVPETLSIEMDDSVLQPLTKQFHNARSIIENEQAAVTAASALIPSEQTARLRASLLHLFETSSLSRGTPFAQTIRAGWGAWEKLSDRELAAQLQALQKEVEKLLDLQAELLRKSQALTPADQTRLRLMNAQMDLATLERLLRQYLAAYLEMGQPKKLDNAGERRRVTQFQGVIGAWQKVLVQARDDRWNTIRSTWPELPRCCVDGVDLIHGDWELVQKTAGTHALTNRLDLMNTRAQVVDAWRQLAVYANSLLGIFTVQYQLNASSPPGVAQPTNIGGSATTNQLILNASPPLARVVQRNNYRASQISYQARQRRALQEAEDLAVQAVKAELSNLRQYSEQYKIQQRQLELAYLTIDSSLESLEAPVAPAPPVPALARAPADGPAALTQQLLSAQRSLPTAQNALLLIWVSYLDQRLQLYRDLELMPLDQRGVWIDQIRDCDCQMTCEQAAPVGETQPAQSEPRMLPPPLKMEQAPEAPRQLPTPMRMQAPAAQGQK